MVNNAQWDMDILNDLFNERDRDQILAVPLSATQQNDRWMWRWDKKGRYTVRSWYNHLLASTIMQQNTVVSNWNSVWNLNVQPKVKNFMWRCLSGCLPTKKALHDRRVDIETMCSACQQTEETDFHCLVECPFARQGWTISVVGDRSGLSSTMTEWWNQLEGSCNRQYLEYAAVILWGLWSNRNELIWNGKVKSPVWIVSNSLDALRQWVEANSSEKQRAQPLNTVEMRQRWCKPTPGWLKLNVDASVFTNPSMSGFGCVLRDSEGQFIAGLRGNVLGKHTPQLAEAMGVREALSWVYQLQATRVIVKTDSQLVCDAINGETDDVSSFGMIISDCKSLVQGLDQCKVAFMRRSANIVAHSIARAAASVSGCEVWVGSPPHFISDVLISDLS